MSEGTALRKRPRAVLDTNQFVSGVLFSTSLPSRMLAAWERRLFALALSASLYAEIATVLERPHFHERYGLTRSQILELLDRLANSAEVVEPVAILLAHVRNPKDEHVLATALGGAVDFLVTGDRDLLALVGDAALGTLRIVTPRQFLVALGQAPEQS